MHHWLDRHKFEQALGVGDGQGSLACCSPWGHKESDMTEQLNWTDAFEIQLDYVVTFCSPSVDPLISYVINFLNLLYDSFCIVKFHKFWQIQCHLFIGAVSIQNCFITLKNVLCFTCSVCPSSLNLCHPLIFFTIARNVSFPEYLIIGITYVPLQTSFFHLAI